MSFINPLMLIGALAGILPIIFHLIYRKKAKSHPFPAVRFLFAGRKKSVFLSRLEEIILLVVRVLIVLLLCLAFARPVNSSITIRSDGINYLSSILIDDSYSMAATAEGRTAFENAKKLAEDFIKSTPVNERVFISWTSQSNVRKDDTVDRTKDEILTEIRKKELSFKKNKLIDSLTGSLHYLVKRKGGVKRIIILGDVQRFSWLQAEKKVLKELSEEFKENAVDLFFVDMTEQSDSFNIAVKNIIVKNRSVYGQIGVEVTAEVENYSENPVKDLLLSVYIDNKIVAKSFIQIDKWKTEKKRFFIPSSKITANTGKVAIEPIDNLPIDDERYFSLNKATGIKILVVDGDSRPFPFDSETFYLMNALNPGAENNSPFEAILTTPENLSPSDIDNYDAIALCNIQQLSSSVIKSIEKNLQSGMGVFISPGSHTEAESYNRMFKNILPAKLRGIKELKGEEFEYLNDIKTDHPILDVFVLPTSGDFRKSIFNTYFLLQQHNAKGAQYIMNYSKGSPYLVLGEKGKGKTAFISSSIDREWNNFSIQTTFLPLIHQVMLYLTDNLKQPQKDLLIGDKKEIDTRGDVRNVTVTDPRGKEKGIDILKTNMDVGEYSYTNYMGIYKVKYTANNKSNKKQEESFVVNLKTAPESDLKKISEEELREFIEKDKLTIISYEKEKDLLEIISKHTTAKPLWHPIMFAIIFLFFVEGFLCRRGAEALRL